MNFGFIPIKIYTQIAAFSVIVFIGGAITEGNIYIRDLEVHPVPYRFRSLQLSISWKLFNATGVTFDVLVRPINMRPNDTCSERPCSVYSQNETTILLPKNPSAYVDEECTIQPLCEYSIKVSTSNRNFAVNKNISIPECVEGICSCQHRELLPSLRLTGQIVSKHQINITWTMYGGASLPRNVTVQRLNLEIREQTSNKYIYIPIEHTSIDKVVGLNFSANTSTVWTLSRSLSPEGVYLLNGHLEDNRGCNKKDISTILKYISPHKSADKLADTENHGTSNTTTTVVITIVVITCIIVGSIAYARYRQRQKRRKKLQSWLGVYHNNTQSSGATHVQMLENVIYVDNDILEARAKGEADYLEVPHSCLTIGREIGKGAFGRVFIARAEKIGMKQGAQIVAVKQLKKRPTTDELEEFLSEIATMKKVGHHPNIVSLLGCCTIKQPLIMIMEYVGSGDLLQYLRQVRARHEIRCALEQNKVVTSSNSNSIASQSGSQIFGGKYVDVLHNNSSNSDASYITQPDIMPSVLRPSVTETLYTMLSAHDRDSIKTSNSIEYVLDHNELKFFALQIARGMKHLEEKQITHRDLAARNILIDENKVLKISDFGLSRTGIYVNTKNKKVPLRWLSIEAMRDNLYSSRSDVWAFAIVLWEIGTLGGFPYPTIGNHELLTYLQGGNRLWKPENCSTTLYDLMLKCWSSNPEMRPTFSEIYSKLEPRKERIYIDFNELGPNYTLPPTSEQVLQN